MCGIAGIVDLKGTREIDRDALTRMSDALRHRGPEAEGFFVQAGVGFAHRRLAIIDAPGGAQPFLTQDRGCVLNYNGEIYNYAALARDLAASGLQMRTRSDTEVLAEGVAKHGIEFVNKLRGMFAFACWNGVARRLWLARDRLGEKPLYYAETDDGFLVFASETGAIIQSGLIETSLDHQAVADYFYYGYVPDPKSIFRNIKKLPPAHYLTAENGELSLDRYWRPVFAENTNLTFEAAAQMLEQRLDETVAAQMVSDAPLGAFLSGGIDSAGILSSMRAANGELVTCTIGFDDESHDECDDARKIAEKFGSRHHETMVNIDAAALIDEVAGAYGEPFADSSALPSYCLARMARQHVTVALSGDGGDELFAGYRRYPFFLAEEQLRAHAPLALRRMLFGPAGAIYPKLDWAPRPFRFKSTLQSLSRNSAEGYAASVAINHPPRARNMLRPAFRRALNGYDPRSVVAKAMKEANTDNPLNAALYTDLMTWLPGRMLTKVDRASMAHSLEVRPPLLDHQMVEWAGMLPSEFKLAHGISKRVLKSALEWRLGKDYVHRKKRGFDVPVSKWMKQSNQGPMAVLLNSRAWRECGFLDVKSVERMARAHQSGAANCGQELWSVVMFDAFLRNARR